MIQSISDRVTEQLRNYIRRTDELRLPSVTSLAKTYGVSRATVLRAVHRLRDEGFLTFSARSRMTIRRHINEDSVSRAQSRGKAADRVYATLETWIRDGRYKKGRPIPKIAYIAAILSVSTKTVGKALEHLSRKRYIHKSGRQWIVGPPEQHAPVPFTSYEARRKILVLTPSADHWNHFCSTVRFLPFGQAFAEQASAHGIQIEPFFSTPKDKSLSYEAMNRDAVSRIRKLQERFVGTLIPAIPGTPENLIQWIRILTDYRKPVCFFDRNNTNTQFKQVSNKHFYRFFIDESRVVSRALEFLYAHGHRTVSFPYETRNEWQHVRWEKLTEAASRYGMTIVPFAGFNFGDASPEKRVEKIERRLDRLKQLNSRPLKELFDRLNTLKANCNSLLKAMDLHEHSGKPCAILLSHFEATEELPEHQRSTHKELLSILSRLFDAAILLKSIERPDITAIIAPNDMIGRSYLSVLHLLGCEIPRDISIVSFDNWFRFSFFPLTTIDFGLASLGYRALHILLGDTPGIERDHDIAASPYVEDRGSVRVRAAVGKK